VGGVGVDGESEQAVIATVNMTTMLALVRTVAARRWYAMSDLPKFGYALYVACMNRT
jgi:hypothetical protein